MAEIIKNFYKNNIDNLVQSFFKSNDHSTNFFQSFFQKLHEEDINKLYNKSFNIKIKNIEDYWGLFYFGLDYFDDEEQTLYLNTNENFKNENFKKVLLFSTYLHETSHEKQRDYFNYNNQNHIPETSNYNKLLNIEILCITDAVMCEYAQQFVEIDAIYNSIKRLEHYFNSKLIDKSIEALNVQLYNCVRYMASINFGKHHYYCPEDFTLDSKELMEFYKKYYAELKINNKNIDYIITNSELYKIKADELKNINYDEVLKELNDKNKFVYDVMEKCYIEMLKKYKPSNEMKKHFNINKTNPWEDIVENNNIVKMSALICDDLNSQFTGSKLKILPQLKTENEELELN